MRNTEQQSDHIYYTLFCRCTGLLRLLARVAKCAIMLWQNHFPEPNRRILTFLHPILIVQDHILSTAGDAVRHIHTCYIPTKNQFWNQYKIRLAWKFQKGPNARTSYQCLKKIQQQHQAGMSFKKFQYQHQAGMFKSR